MQKSKIIRTLFITLFIFVPFLSLHSQELQDIQDRSIQELSTYFRKGKIAIDYTKEQIAKIDDLKDDAGRRINNSSDKEMVLEIFDEAKKNIDMIETYQELQKIKENLKADAEKYLKPGSGPSDYTKEKLEEIASIRKKYGKEIDQSTDIPAANTQFEEAKREIDKVPTSLELLSSLDAAYKTLEEKSKQLELELANKQDKEEFIVKELFSLIAISLVFLVITFSIITHVKFKKYNVTNLDKVEKLESSMHDFQNLCENRHSEINNRIHHVNEEIKNINAKSKIEHEIKKSVEAPKPIDKPPLVESFPADPIKDFNNWAADPSMPLPNWFYYVKGEIKLRAEQNFSESSSPTEWICNKRTDKHYLLPNPNFFEELTNIKSFYKMDIGQLKPRGQNKIKVIEPCKMSDRGWIDNPGELEFK
ncbi:MAG: hypothetical protein LBU51_03495 [Bacteroidales bacterium]|jgi:hypothetical protein|nr:hypothetical protein [Bacteroidales bacterium]